MSTIPTTFEIENDSHTQTKTIPWCAESFISGVVLNLENPCIQSMTQYSYKTIFH